jgi:hypothetical protein
MTSTTETTTERVYVRNRGYGELLEIHADNSATVSYEPSSIHDGCDHPAADGTERVPFGDWIYAATSQQYADKSAVTIKHLVRDRLKRDLGEDFHVTGEILGPGDAASFLAYYGPSFTIEVKVAATPQAGEDPLALISDLPDDTPWPEARRILSERYSG